MRRFFSLFRNLFASYVIKLIFLIKAIGYHWCPLTTVAYSKQVRNNKDKIQRVEDCKLERLQHQLFDLKASGRTSPTPLCRQILWKIETYLGRKLKVKWNVLIFIYLKKNISKVKACCWNLKPSRRKHRVFKNFELERLLVLLTLSFKGFESVELWNRLVTL